MAYLLDANVFVTLKNEMPIDIFPSLWLQLETFAAKGKIYSCSKVREEIFCGNDDLKEWCHTKLPSSFFLHEDCEIMRHYAHTIAWATSNPVFTEVARREYASVADAYLVATAAAKSYTLVTYEKSNPLCKRRVLIPDACIAAGVTYWMPT